MKNNALPVIIQARTGSTRLPGKMLKPFFGNKTIPELIIEELSDFLPGSPIVLATTVNPNDDALAALAENAGIMVFRGSEDNVLERFMMCAEHFGFSAFLRVCADNPFLCGRYAKFLAERFHFDDFDYFSFVLEDGTPVIRSHFGFFCEAVSLRALKKTASLTQDKFFLEHVTNFIYGHSDEFSIAFSPVPAVLNARRDIRLTIDTARDFEDVSLLYRKFRESKLSLSAETLCTLLQDFPDIRTRMAETIVNMKK